MWVETCVSVWFRRVVQTLVMATRDQLHELVDQLDDTGAERLLATTLELVSAPRPPRSELPAFVGSFGSGCTDASERAEEILRAELGAALRS